MWHDSVSNTVQKPTVTSIIVAKKTTTWGESGFPSEFLARSEEMLEENPPSDASRRAVDLTALDTFIEFKRRIGTASGGAPNPQYVEQLDDYLTQSASRGRVRMGVLTDGKRWLLRCPRAGGTRKKPWTPAVPPGRHRRRDPEQAHGAPRQRNRKVHTLKLGNTPLWPTPPQAGKMAPERPFPALIDTGNSYPKTGLSRRFNQRFCRWFSGGFLAVFRRFSDSFASGFPAVFQRFPGSFPAVFQRFCQRFPSGFPAVFSASSTAVGQRFSGNTLPLDQPPAGSGLLLHPKETVGNSVHSFRRTNPA